MTTCPDLVTCTIIKSKPKQATIINDTVLQRCSVLNTDTKPCTATVTRMMVMVQFLPCIRLSAVCPSHCGMISTKTGP